MDLSTQAGQEILGDIKRNTSSSRPWRNLMLLCFDQKDIDTFKTLQIICEGLDKLFAMKKQEAKREFEAAVKAIRESKLKPGQRQLPNPIITVVPFNDGQRQTFLRLASTPNNCTLLEKVAGYYLNDWGIPEIAQKHLERALNFEPEDQQLLQTLAKAAEALAHSVPMTEALTIPHISAPVAASRDSLAQTMRLKLPQMLQRAPADLPRERSQTLLKHHIEMLNEQATQPKENDFKSANLGTLHQQLKTLQSKIDMIEQRTQRPPPQAPSKRSGPSIVPSSLSSAELLSKSLADVHSGNLDDAAECCRRALEIDPDQPLVWHTWATIGLGYFEKRQYDQSINAFNEALRLEPNAVESWFNMGIAYSEKGDREGALRCYLRSLFLAPENSKVRCNLGAVYFQNSQFSHAEQCFRKAIELNPEYARAWDNLGATLSAQGQMDEAADACRKAIELRPDYSEAYFKLGTILFQQEKFDESRSAFENAAQYRDDFPASFIYLALLDARAGKLSEAESHAEKAAALGGVPGLDWLSWQEIALGHLQQKNVNAALAAARHAVQLQGREPEPWFTLGMVEHQSGNFDAAIEAYTRCLKLRADMPFGWYNLGLIYWEQKRYEFAANAMQHAVDHDPSNASAWFHLGEARETLQENEQAIEAYKKTIELDPKQVEAWQNLGLLLEESNRHEEAEEVRNHALVALGE